MEETRQSDILSQTEHSGTQGVGNVNDKQQFWVYLLSCSDQSLYCGSTTDLNRRIDEHNAKRGAKYTATRLPVRLAQAWAVFSWSDALRLEAAVKKCPRPEKEKLVRDPAGIIKVAQDYGFDFVINW